MFAVPDWEIICRVMLLKRCGLFTQHVFSFSCSLIMPLEQYVNTLREKETLYFFQWKIHWVVFKFKVLDRDNKLCTMAQMAHFSFPFYFTAGPRSAIGRAPDS